MLWHHGPFTKEDVLPQTVDQKTVLSWTEEFNTLNARIAQLFSRSEVRGRVRTYLQALLGSVERKNSWQLAEALGHSTPYGIQHLLGRTNWNADLLRDDLREYVLEHLGDKGGMQVVDEMGFLKKDTESMG